MLKAVLFFLSLLVVSSATDLPTLSPTSGPTSVRSSQYSIQSYLGTGSASTSGTGGLASVATVNQPRSVWMDSTDALYVSECQGNCVRIVDTSNIVRDFAGTCGSSGSSGDGGPASSAQMQYPLGLYISSTSVVYVTDFTAFRVRSVTPSGIITTFLGTGTGPNSGDGGAASSASMDGPHSIWGNSVGVIYVGSYSGYLIRAVSALGIITLFAGSGTKSFSGDGGPATSCSISRPSKMFGATTGTVYFTDQENYRVRMIGTSGIISTIMGSGGTAYSGESVAATASSVSVGTDLKLDPNNGDLFVSDYTLARVFVMTGSSQLVSTFAGTGTSGSSGNGGAATSAQVNGPDGLWLDQNSFKVYLAEQQGYTVRLIYSTAPTASPSRLPSLAPSVVPSVSPTMSPTCLPSLAPSVIPSASPTVSPTVSPTCLPSLAPSVIPSASPTVSPSLSYLSIRSSPSYKVTNALAFAGITSNGSVIAWGASGSGGDCSAVSSRLSNVVEIVSSKHAFAALKSDGAVVAWGNNGEIDGWSAATTGVTVTSLVGSERAFAGVTEGGAVIAFGADCCGGNVDQYGWAVQYLSSDVKSVTASAGAFCALKTDGRVYCWGSEFAGGGVSSVSRSYLTDIVLLTSTRSAFAGMTSDGNVITWGNHEFGGSVSDAVSSAVAGNTLHILSNQRSFAAYTTSGVISTWGTSEVTVDVGSDVKYVAHSSGAFAAILGNGSVLSWGDAKVGGGVAVPANVTHIVGNVGAFAALSVDGESVIVWGAESYGGSLNGSLVSVKSLMGSSRAFAALLSNGSVVAWGSVGAGGVISSEVENYLSSGVRLLCANDVAFTAIKTDGSAVTWGHTLSVVSSVINGGFEELNEC